MKSRTETEMMNMILTAAKDDDRVRAVILNGSRANPNVKKDIFQDYDIVYIVREMESFTCDHSWVDVFGEQVMMKMPDVKEFADLCNEFWWITMNVSKGLWRRELTYAMFMHEQINRNVLITMLEWKAGIAADFTKSAGKAGKYHPDFLPAGDWEQFQATYSDAEFEHIWDALFTMCPLFRNTAIEVAEKLGFEYPFEDDKRVTGFLKHVRRLPEDANSIYLKIPFLRGFFLVIIQFKLFESRPIHHFFQKNGDQDAHQQPV